MYLLFANIVDIRQINADGKKSKTLVQEPRGSIIALDYDPVQKQVKDHTCLKIAQAEEAKYIYDVFTAAL